ncbi:MAG TPA: prolyl oligopeptidase family serine peptidase [Gemmataceae bacterium]|nr:prolyl oligopeptidase family serine peptidase [Gemmataceae bacterium]
MKYTATAFVFLFACASAAFAGKTKWTIDDVILTESLRDIQVSPDGRWAVWVHVGPNKERGEAIGNLVRLDLSTGRETILTRGSENCRSPRWAPDGQRLAFLRPRSAAHEHATDDDAKNQIWLMDPSGGEAWPLTEWPSEILQFDWAGSESLIFSAKETPTLRASTLKGEKDDSIVVEDERNEPPVRLFRIEASSKKVTRLSDNRDRIEKLAVSSDGRYAVAVHQRSLSYNFDNKVKPAVLLHDLHSGKVRQLFGEPHWNIQHLQWSPDSRGFYAVNMHNSQPRFAQSGILQLHYFDLDRNAVVAVDLAWERGLAEQEDSDDTPALAVTRNGFVALLADGVHTKAARYTRTDKGWRRDWLVGEHADHMYDLQVSPDGKTLFYSYSTASTPTRWYHTKLDGSRLGKPCPFGVHHSHLAELPHARTEVMSWKGARGDEVQGILYYPHDYRERTKYPLVVMIHGGPAAADRDAWEDWWMYPTNLVCQQGAFVLKANYHGSAGYGLEWLESITRGRYGDLETIDIEKGIDRLIESGFVDPGRLAVSGWSNGAILANRLTAKTTRYKAAIAGAGNVEYVSDWANCEFGDAFNRYYLGASPLEKPFLYFVKSPFYRLQRVRTPTLIFFGSEDQTVPVHQGWVQYRALQQIGKTDVRFVLFPGEKHSLTKLAHQRRKVKEELAWLDRYLFSSVVRSNPAVKADSPLGWAIKRRQARREAGRYGVMVKGRLIPETVTYGELRIGRFEVTRAQFAEFDKTYKIEPGRENYPANGITFERAKDYCSWLSKQTGRTYRLPTEEEAEKLYENSEGEENTLDHWAGYAVNPDDAVRLRETLNDRGGEALLLKEVGSFRAAGDEQAVFDLGGNVAEWVAMKDGKGAVRGGSADAPADSKQKANQAGEGYRGFRVVEERGSR